MKRYFSILVLMFTVIGCANQFHSIPQVVIQKDSRLHFSGKGAGAGMMLMSAMGPMGIAIGVAIDEGIAKEIAETAEKGSVSIEQIIRDSLQHNQPTIKFTENTTLSIERYGFLVAPGDGDKVLAQLHIRVVHLNQQNEILVKYPEDFLQEPDSLLKHDLDDVKTNVTVITELWRDAVDKLLSKQ